jgi:hypothetical protein
LQHTRIGMALHFTFVNFLLQLLRKGCENSLVLTALTKTRNSGRPSKSSMACSALGAGKSQHNQTTGDKFACNRNKGQLLSPNAIGIDI